MLFQFAPQIFAPLLAILLLLALPVQAETTSNAMLEVTLKAVRDARGALRVGLYREPATFRKEDKAVAVEQVSAAPGEVVVRFRDLAPGRYAIMAYHDENGDGTLNRRFGMFPTEGYGLSNNPKVSGPPAFDDSAFEVAAPETKLSIDLRY